MKIDGQIDAAERAATGLARRAGITARDAILRIVGEVGAIAAVAASGEAVGTLNRAGRVDADRVLTAGANRSAIAAVVRVPGRVDAHGIAAGVATVGGPVAVFARVGAGDAAIRARGERPRPAERSQCAERERRAFEEAAAVRSGGKRPGHRIESFIVHRSLSLARG